MQTYTVKKGDTLYGISNQFGVSVTDILKVNNIDPNKLPIDYVLNIPSISGSNPDATFNYIVKKGDTLYNIALKYDTTVGDIISLNNLKTTALSIGQVLKIPETFLNSDNLPTFISYIIKSGDNLYSIARSYSTTVDEIMKDNGLTSNVLKIGQVLKIRTTSSDVMECFGTNYVEEDTSQSYTVKRGDNLYSIARKFNMSVDSIKKKNNLSSNIIQIGQVLKI